LSCLLSTVIYGQAKETPFKKIYLQLGTGGSSHNGVFSEFGVQAVLKHNWTTTFSWRSMEMDPKNLPANYEPGYTILIIIPFSDPYPSIKANIYSFMGGKCFEAGRKVWFTTDAGVSIVNGDKISFAPRVVVDDGWYRSSNYIVEKEKKTMVGGMLKADFNWAFLSFAGLGAGVFANFNSIQSSAGFEIKLICGWMNRKGKH
jgi:hypothetical protein